MIVCKYIDLISQLRVCLQVIVIDHGAIAEEGTHDELIAKDGVYKKLVLRQLTAGDAMGVTKDQEGEESEKNGKPFERKFGSGSGRGKNGGIMRMASC